MIIQIWRDQSWCGDDFNYAICKKGDQVFRATEVEGNYYGTKVAEIEIPKGKYSWDKLLEMWKNGTIDYI
jgi:hypothetical protein